MNKLKWVLLSILLLCNVIYADNKIYKEYAFGTNKSDIEKLTGVYDCSEYTQSDAMCLDRQKFNTYDVSLVFEFIQSKLARVWLVSNSQETMLMLMSVMTKKFIPITLESQTNQIDIVYGMLNDFDTIDYEMKDFSKRALTSGYLKYTYIDLQSFNKTFSKTTLNASDIVKQVDNNTRMAELIINNDGKFMNTFVIFTLPKLLEELVDNQFKTSSLEDF